MPSGLTVGDGKFGSDAFLLKSKGIDVVVTSISSHTLKWPARRAI